MTLHAPPRGAPSAAAPPGLTDYYHPVIDNAALTLSGRDVLIATVDSTPTAKTTADGAVTQNVWQSGSAVSFRASGADPRLNGFRYANVANAWFMVTLPAGDYYIDAAFGHPSGFATVVQWELYDGTGWAAASQTLAASQTRWDTAASEFGDLGTPTQSYTSAGWFARTVTDRARLITVTDRSSENADATGIQLRWSLAGAQWSRLNYIRIFTP